MTTASKAPACGLILCRTAGRQSTTALALALSLACACAKSARESRAEAGASSASPVERGETVVIEQTAASFQQTRVLEVEPGKVRVESADDAESQWIQVADVYRLGSERPPPAGALAICRPAPGKWLPCRVERLSAGLVFARDAQGADLALRAMDVLLPRPVTELNLRRYFERAGAARAFLDAFRNAGEPARPRHWVPGPHARVLAKRDGAWYSARIHEYDDEVPRVRFALDDRISEVPLAELAPEPPEDVTGLHRGDFVLTRPSGSAEPWRPAQVHSLGDQEFRVSDLAGSDYSVSVRDLVPLAPPGNESDGGINADR
ncbi:MAG TPA: hypothetical protein VGP93_12735 [Polyangiaceae bacterium]|jgi:hypothetical protein|nr:hypothetical protein [Polyangiaceae bacterium]